MKTLSNFILMVICCIGVCILHSGCYYDKEELLYGGNICDTSTVTFSRSVSPILSSSCNSCHSGNTPSYGVRLDNYIDVKTQVDNNKLAGVITHATGFSPMPKNAAKLSDCNIAIITNWINAGAPNN